MKRTASWFAMDEGYYTKWCPVEGKRTDMSEAPAFLVGIIATVVAET